VIKVVRAATALGLKESKDWSKVCPPRSRKGWPRPTPKKLKKELEEAGGQVSIK